VQVITNLKKLKIQVLENVAEAEDIDRCFAAVLKQYSCKSKPIKHMHNVTGNNKQTTHLYACARNTFFS
jgi:hypothetical protein